MLGCNQLLSRSLLIGAKPDGCSQSIFCHDVSLHILNTWHAAAKMINSHCTTMQVSQSPEYGVSLSTTDDTIMLPVTKFNEPIFSDLSELLIQDSASYSGIISFTPEGCIDPVCQGRCGDCGSSSTNWDWENVKGAHRTIPASDASCASCPTFREHNASCKPTLSNTHLPLCPAFR